MWAYHETQDASDPTMFGKHSYRNYTMETHQIVFEGMDMPSTPPAQPTTEMTTTPPSSGLQLSISFLSIPMASILNILVRWKNLGLITPLRADFFFQLLLDTCFFPPYTSAFSRAFPLHGFVSIEFQLANLVRCVICIIVINQKWLRWFYFTSIKMKPL